jgi:hypothetical protein
MSFLYKSNSIEISEEDISVDTNEGEVKIDSSPKNDKMRKKSISNPKINRVVAIDIRTNEKDSLWR